MPRVKKRAKKWLLMRQDELDRILSVEQEIIPSSGFVDSVMAAVRSEAAMPQPIPFPWKLALPGFAVAVLSLARVLFAGMDPFTGTSAARLLPEVFRSAFPLILEAAKRVGAGWIAVALVLSLASVKLGVRLADKKV